MARVSHNTKPWVPCVESSLIPRDLTLSFLLQAGKAGRQVGKKAQVGHLALQVEAGSFSEGQGFRCARFGHPSCPVSAEFSIGELHNASSEHPGLSASLVARGNQAFSW